MAWHCHSGLVRLEYLVLGGFLFHCLCAIILFFAAVAQLDRVLGYEPRGRGFDSCQPHQIQGIR